MRDGDARVMEKVRERVEKATEEARAREHTLIVQQHALCGQRIIALVTGCSFVDGVFIPAGHGPITNAENCLSVYTYIYIYIHVCPPNRYGGGGFAASGAVSGRAAGPQERRTRGERDAAGRTYTSAAARRAL